MEDMKNKKIKKMGLDKFISRGGFLRFKDYHSKLKMMNTALFLFGMKLHR
jgi:hypothetical protein